MSFATINGVTLEALAGTFREEADNVQGYRQRGINGRMTASRLQRRRIWTTERRFRRAEEARAFRALLEGSGQHWTLSGAGGVVSSSKGLGPTTGGAWTTSGSGGPWAGYTEVASGSFARWSVAQRLDLAFPGWSPVLGWTLAVWKRLSVGDGGDGTTYFSHVATGAVPVTRGASANPVGVTQWRGSTAGSWAMGNWIDVGGADATRISIHGVNNANANAAFRYADLVFLPFLLPASWTAEFLTFRAAQAWPDSVRVQLGGDCVDRPCLAFGEARTLTIDGRILEGSYRNNATALRIELQEA